MYQHKVTATISDTLRIGYSSQQDKCIMEGSTLQQYSPQQQRDINLVRLYLQAITLSDLSTPDGKSIRTNSLHGICEEAQHIRQNWPRQEAVTAPQRQLWTRYIKTNFLRYDKNWINNLGHTRPELRPCTPRPHAIAPIMSDQSMATTFQSLVPEHLA